MKKGVYRYTVNEINAGQRLDQFLAGCCDDLSRGMARKLIDIGGVHLAGRRTRRCAQIVVDGQGVELYVDGLPLDPFRLTADQILYQDAYLIGLDKPVGVATQPTPARYKGTLYDALLALLTDPYRRSQKPSIGMVQRLDRDTSGVMVFSIHPEAHKDLTVSFREKQVRKVYLALVEGQVASEQGVIKSQLARRRASNLMVSVPRGGKYAETRYRLIESFDDASLLEVEIPTGRSHQIRAHFSEQGHPLLGDTVYGGHEVIAGISVPRQMLHARELQFRHPVNGQAMTLATEPPEDFSQVLRQLSDG
ncbi:MAG: RluA family pseudouridine synthase [Desulfuromonadales bacterium]|jgi:23S rRNA pseudouridine1911/1915/1917 synthase|nr:RluA family pseudouridine synthase [Desulfuromonadales bacterium]